MFHLLSGGGDFEEVTITGGRTAGFDSEGGGIRSELEDVRLQRSVLVDNHSVGNGGGVWVGSDRNIDFDESLVVDNVADGSGGAAWTAGEVAALGSTVVDNMADVAGGAIYSGTDVVRVNTSTLTGNSADDGGAIYAPRAIVENATIVGNRSPGAGGASIEVPDLATALTVVAPDPAAGSGVACSDDADSDGGSYDTDGTCGFTDDATDTSGGGDPMLGPLQDNGGDLETMEPLPGSPLRDVVPPATTACDPFPEDLLSGGVDQRGVPRPQGGACDTGAVETPVPFNDVPVDHPFFDEINLIAYLGVTTGFPDGGFHPAGSVTRQAMAAFLFRLSGAEVVDADADADTPDAATFSDVPEDHPFYDEIEWLVANGITTGYGDGTFRPADLVTRQAIAAFIFRLSELVEGPEATGGDGAHAATFSDVPEDHPFYDEIEWLFEVGLTTGYPDGTYRPSATMTRQAMAAFLARAIEAELVGGGAMG